MGGNNKRRRNNGKMKRTFRELQKTSGVTNPTKKCMCELGEDEVIRNDNEKRPNKMKQYQLEEMIKVEEIGDQKRPWKQI